MLSRYICNLCNRVAIIRWVYRLTNNIEIDREYLCKEHAGPIREDKK